MGLPNNTNIASIGAINNLAQASTQVRGSLARASSGLRIAVASDDPAGLGISEMMRSQIRSFSAAGRNTQDGVSLAQVAEGGLSAVSGQLGRMRELAIQASNGTLSNEDRALIDTEFQALGEEVDRIANSTEFNGISVLNSGGSVSIQAGTEFTDAVSLGKADVRASTLGLESLSTTTAAGSASALASIDAALVTVSSARESFGSAEGALSSRFESLQVARENLVSAESRIRDADQAFESADLTRNSIVQHGAASVASQANLQPQLAASLL